MQHPHCQVFGASRKSRARQSTWQGRLTTRRPIAPGENARYACGVENCCNCGQETRLYVSRVPWCLTCYQAVPEARKLRNLLKPDPDTDLPDPSFGSRMPTLALAVAERLVPETQQILIAFLQADLNLSATLLETAEVARSCAHVTSALTSARRGLQVIRHLVQKVDDPGALADIRARAEELEFRLEKFPV
jgi:hypothetical protein